MPTLLILATLSTIGLAVWWGAQALVLEQSIGEGRAVADMSENVGRWASQYGGVHVRTRGAQAKLPGSFLTRSVYPNETAAGEAAVAAAGAERAAMDSLEIYYWKNPALIQREVADVVTAAGSRLQYRMTARTVLNSNNQPNALDLTALDAIQAAFEQQPPEMQGKPGAHALEYWTVEAGRLIYARAVLAQPSCLRCHDTPATAPDFLKTNAMFNGGGGFGYVAGKPAGLISVSVPMPSTWAALRSSLPLQVWIALAVALALAVCTVVAMRGRRNS